MYIHETFERDLERLIMFPILFWTTLKQQRFLSPAPNSITINSLSCNRNLHMNSLPCLIFPMH